LQAAFLLAQASLQCIAANVAESPLLYVDPTGRGLPKLSVPRVGEENVGEGKEGRDLVRQ